MLDMTMPSDRNDRAAPRPPAMQRARGCAAVSLSALPGPRGVRRLYQSGSAKAFLPRAHGPRTELVYLNTAGGLTGGDRMDFELRLDPQARAVATTQTAERAYAALSGGGADGAARLTMTVDVGQGAALDWLPQETILFEDSALCRETTVTLHGDARVLLAESVVFGRAAMGETLMRARLHDRRRVYRDGRPIYLDPQGFGPDDLAPGAGPAGLSGARAIATMALLAPGAEDALGPVRKALAGVDGVRAAASGWDGKCILRLMAADAQPLKRALAAAAAVLGDGPLPRVWQTE